MNQFKNFTFYPVTGWHIGPLSGHQALVLQFGYLDPEAPRDQLPQETPFLGLTLDMAKKLVSNLNEHIDHVEKKRRDH